MGGEAFGKEWTAGQRRLYVTILCQDANPDMKKRTQKMGNIKSREINHIQVGKIDLQKSVMGNKTQSQRKSYFR